MPMARQKSSAGLSIELSDGQKYYMTGSKVSGDVVLDTAQDFAIGSVSLEFYGRVKVHYVQSHGQGESHWRGRAPLFSESVLLYEGYHTHKPGSFRWPFTFEIPTHPDAAAMKQSKHQWKEKEHYLSTEDYIPAHPMPATFGFRKWGFGYRWHIFIEYVLKVEVKQADGSRVLLPPSSRKTTLPILVKEVSTENPHRYTLPLATQFTLPDQLMEKSWSNNSQSAQPQLATQEFTSTVRSSRLLLPKSPEPPVNTRSSFSFREKAKQVFNSSSLPRYTFQISVSTPQTIRLLQQDAIPFIVRVSSIQGIDSTTIEPDDYPDIRIDNLSIVLNAITYLRCKGPFPPRPTDYDIELLDRQPVDHTFEMKPQKGHSDQSSSSRHDNDKDNSWSLVPSPDRIDLSKLSGLSVAVIGAKMGRHTEKPLSPSFNTYIIAREYKVKWKLELDVTGEKVKLQNREDIPVKITAPRPEDLAAIMKEGDVTVAENNENEDLDEEESEADEGQSNSKGDSSLGSLLKLRKGKKTKQEEAAEESVSAGPSSSQPLQFHHDEMLPRYEQGPNDFGYRHEIDEGPPQYEKDKKSKCCRSFLQMLGARKSAEDSIIA